MNRKWNVRICVCVGVICAVGALLLQAQIVTEPVVVDQKASAELQSFKAKVQAAHPGMEVVSVESEMTRSAVLAPRKLSEIPKIAIFVKNQTRVQGMDDTVDGVRDRISAELAGAGLIVMDKTEIADGFNRFKVATAEERAGLIDGIFTGGSTLRVAQMLGVDYIMLVSVISASHTTRVTGDKPVTIFTLRVSTKINEATQGSSVYGSNWSNKIPVPGQYTDGADGLNYYNDLFDQWVSVTGAEISEKRISWRRGVPADSALVEFSVSTTVDTLIQGLESGVRASNELLNELRRTVGGVTVEIDGVAVGSTPGIFKTTMGLHQMRVSRQWMKPWQQTINIQPGAIFQVALELSETGLSKYQSLEGFRSAVAVGYAEAVMRKGVKVNFDTAAWRDVGNRTSDLNIQPNVIP